MRHRARIAAFAASAAAATATLAGCSSDDDTKAAPASRPVGTTKAAATTTGFPEPPPYTYEIKGKQIFVLTNSADPTDLQNTFNKVSRTVGPTPKEEGIYVVRIDCGFSDATVRRLANGRCPVGQANYSLVGGVKFGGVVSGPHCP